MTEVRDVTKSLAANLGAISVQSYPTEQGYSLNTEISCMRRRKGKICHGRCLRAAIIESEMTEFVDILDNTCLSDDEQ